ncbi:helicase [Sandarakinorhabdus cyanobacteriorum]|uniref:Helicase n=1 Tax=Sandarakinorhabdus cyanobacteriorum TaxID=1981098 RepID=A0A255Y3Q0_9SPHN|nr:DEAD/DEAH box helicase [Sandarakinorhabdus cyanobacteriorum]OYQ23889.1 helicase [Sandarakinorhabdus cyanobacteriorum]
MRIVTNSPGDRPIDLLSNAMATGTRLQLATHNLTLGGLAAAVPESGLGISVELLVSGDLQPYTQLPGAFEERRARNGLRSRKLADVSLNALTSAGSVRAAKLPLAQSWIIATGEADIAMAGSCSLTLGGLGLVPETAIGMVTLADDPSEVGYFKSMFASHWHGAKPADSLILALSDFAGRQAVPRVYAQSLRTLFREIAETDPTTTVKAATGIRQTRIWSKLYRFQRDGVIGAIEKLERFGGCILADSVGLGKTFEALAVIKYFELRNDRVLVLAPKRLRENWTIWRQNDTRNDLAVDRFNYDVLNHTDLSRDGGLSGDIDLDHINWGNYDLVVIDESHNFRNRPTGAEHDSRYDRLMRKIIQTGVRTRVLMLSATPVNNRLNDLKNQIAFATEGKDDALAGHGISSITATVRLAQSQFNKWQALTDERRSSERLLDMLGFDYFRLLDLLTIARSRKHIEKYYGTDETGRFPDKRTPINIYADTDTTGAFPPIGDINKEIRRLTLAAYAPMKYVLDSKREAYERRYSQAVSGKGTFLQSDREESLVGLMRVNLLKRMESSIHSFVLTIERQLAEVDALIKRIDAHDDTFEAPSIEDLDDDDPLVDEVGIGKRVKLLLADADLPRWLQDLHHDRQRLLSLLAKARPITAARDAKLAKLKEHIAQKRREPFNAGNGKLLIFTAFADTARYLYDALAEEYPAQLALVTGSGANKTNVPGIASDLASLLDAFSPGSRGGRTDRQIDIIIATDCISEGQNLQDCDTVVNYDIHWNPVRIVQRFGRVDRLGSRNAAVQLVNFWPNMDLDAYIGLQKTVSGRMKLLDVSATGEENIIEVEPGDRMNDLDYRRRQLEALQSRAIDLEDLNSGVSITDMTLNDLRMDFTQLPEQLRDAPAIPGIYAPIPASEDFPPGALFILRAETEAALATLDPADPLRPHALVYIGMDEVVVVPHSNPKKSLDLLRLAASLPEATVQEAWARFDRATHNGDRMGTWTNLLERAVAAVGGKAEERAIDALFSRGGAGVAGGGDLDDWEVVAWLAILPPPQPRDG